MLKNKKFFWNFKLFLNPLNFEKKKFKEINLEFLNHAKNIPVILRSSPIKIWGKLVKGFITYDRTYKPTDRKTNRVMGIG